MTRAAVWCLAGAALVLFGSGPAQAQSIPLRPEGDALNRAVAQALAQLSTPELPLRLDRTLGPRLTLGSQSGVPFNPDAVARTVGSGADRRIELNPAGPLPLNEALRFVLSDEFDLGEWTPEAARLRFSGADLNADGVIDLTDLALLMENYGKSGRGDLNGDRRVDDADLTLFGQRYRPE